MVVKPGKRKPTLDDFDPDPGWVKDADLQELGDLRCHLITALADFASMLDKPRQLSQLLDANSRVQIKLQAYLSKITTSLRDRKVYPSQIARVKVLKDDLSQLYAQASEHTKSILELFDAAGPYVRPGMAGNPYFH